MPKFPYVLFSDEFFPSLFFSSSSWKICKPLSAPFFFPKKSQTLYLIFAQFGWSDPTPRSNLGALVSNSNFRFFLFHNTQREYYSCDATYRNWLKFELDNADVPPGELSLEEKERATAVAKEALAASLLLLESESAACVLTAC